MIHENTTTRLSNAQIAKAAEGEPLADEERPILDIDQLQNEAHELHECLNKRQQEGNGRSLPYPGWIEDHIMSLYQQNEKLVSLLIQDEHAIEMADKIFALLKARQDGMISGAHQDIEFGRMVAKKHFPQHTHSDIDAKANENIAITRSSASIQPPNKKEKSNDSTLY